MGSDQIYLSGPKSGPDKWSNPLVSLNLFRKLGENGAPGRIQLTRKVIKSLILFINISFFFIQGYRFVLRMMLLKML